MKVEELDTIVVFTAETVQELRGSGGSEEWPLRKSIVDEFRDKKIRYLVCCRQSYRYKKKHGSVSNEDHRQAFFKAWITNISFLRKDAKGNNRFRIEFDGGNDVAMKEFWPKGAQRSAIYANSSSLDNSSWRSNEDSQKVGFSPGTAIPHNRAGHSTDPQHSKIVHDLLEQLSTLDYRLERVAKDIFPDIVVSKGLKKALFEVKPGDSPCEFFTAIGQLLIYGEGLGPHMKFLVAEGLPTTNRAAFVKVLNSTGVTLISHTRKSDRYHFIDLGKYLNRE